MDFTVAQFFFWTEDEFASDFRKMLTLEQYRNTEMTELYNQCIVEGPVAYMEDLFRELMKEGGISRGKSQAACCRILCSTFSSYQYVR